MVGWFSVNVVVLATTALMEARRSGGTLPVWEPFCWEISSCMVLLLLIPLGLCLAKPLNLIALGDEAAHSLGTFLGRTRWLAMACAVAAATTPPRPAAPRRSNVWAASPACARWSIASTI